MISSKFNKKFYTVYNVIKTTTKDSSVYPIEKVYELYSMLINSEHVVTVEQHISDDKLRSELRVIFWNEASYNLWASQNRKRYDELVTSFYHFNTKGNIQFARYTSLDNYVSEFTYTIYPEKHDLLGWSLIPYHKKILINDLCPLGKIQDYLGKGEFAPAANIEDFGARFIKERSSEIVRRAIKQSITKDLNFPRILAYTFEQSVQTLMFNAPWLYRNLSKLTNDIEQLASKYIIDCDNAAVLIGHNSMGKKLSLHTHRLSDEPRYTLTIIARLTFEDKGALVEFYDPVKDDDPNLHSYYSNPNLLIDAMKNKKSKSFIIESRLSLLTFSASYIPHLVVYDKDIYLFYVYDNVTFKPGMFELIQTNSNLEYLTGKHKDKRLFYQFIA